MLLDPHTILPSGEYAKVGDLVVSSHYSSNDVWQITGINDYRMFQVKGISGEALEDIGSRHWLTIEITRASDINNIKYCDWFSLKK